MTHPRWRILTGGALERLSGLDPQSVQTCVTSPPYFGLRDYDDPAQIGREETLDEYIASLVAVFDEVRRVLRDDGTLWLNIGDTYCDSEFAVAGVKQKEMIGVPWRLAFALQEAGWYLRSEVIWAKPNPVPESVRDRPTKSHEQVFLLTKQRDYAYDAHAIREDGSHSGGGRNCRDVWTIPTFPFKGAHFATFPPKLVEPCILAGAPPDSCAECGAPRLRIVHRERTVDGEAVDGAWAANEAGQLGEQGVGHWRYETTTETLGWRPSCACGAPEGVEPDDLDLIESPTGAASDEDPSLEIGRAGYARPRGDGGGRRTITRYQQRGYARQLRALPDHRVDELTSQDEISLDAWAHYVRTDRGGARPLPAALLERYVREGVLEPVEPPSWDLPATRPSVVLDPFCGAATTGVVALRLERSFVGIELNPAYAEEGRQRVREDAPLFNTNSEAPESARAGA